MRIGWFERMWEQTWEDMTAEQIMALIEAGKYDFPPEVEILVMPDEVKLTELEGDDWNDRPANCNASGINSPAGFFVKFRVGEKIPEYVATALERWSEEQADDENERR